MKQLSEMDEREYFACIGRRPLFVGCGSFHQLTAFLTGYSEHATRHGGPGLLTGRHEWLVARRGRDCNHAWPGQVLHLALPDGWDDISDLPSEDEKHAIKVLFQLLDDFIGEREAARGTHPSD
ncbi:hypothetical protein OH807_18810 [Kitasatospora sp. NBC_01560]|uniref:hypothetical protein n=1 Tax=Kitasatospora sp. NBC_01560 TaxID=2975965 RepID=UPI00386DD828